jgi:hypothetical protein
MFIETMLSGVYINKVPIAVEGQVKEALIENARLAKKELSLMFKLRTGNILNILRYELIMTKVNERWFREY